MQIKALYKTMPLFMSKEKEREYGIYERKEKNVAGDADIYCSCSGYRCRITPVSYTHLDVYKRQEYIYVFAQ